MEPVLAKMVKKYFLTIRKQQSVLSYWNQAEVLAMPMLCIVFILIDTAIQKHMYIVQYKTGCTSIFHYLKAIHVNVLSNHEILND